ncbi:hypothetical protein [Oceanicella sp. SM1341]|uniref:hypothetical protein n=1 Tax=Oceanicella sp. SM1341 TaxID=1548889 RepID=UPI000E482A90|nr:hypothetical protein [Oceanicella sp. SM1341]
MSMAEGFRRRGAGAGAGMLGAAAGAFGLRLGGVACLALAFVVLARTLPAAQVAGLSLAMAAGTLGRYLGPLGFDQLALRHLPRLRAGGRAAMARRLEGALFGGGCAAGSACLAAGLVLLPLSPAAPALLLAGLGALGGAAAGVQRARGEVFRAVFPEGGLAPGLTLAGLLLLSAAGGLTPGAALAVLIGAALPGLVLQLAWLAGGARLRPHLPALRLWREALALWAVQGATLLLNRSALWLAAALATGGVMTATGGGGIMTATGGGGAMTAAGGMAEVAWLDAGLRLALLPGLAGWAAGMVLAPQVSALGARGDGAGLQAALTLGCRLATAPALALLGLLALAGEGGMVAVLGPGFAAATTPALILLAAAAVDGATGLSALVILHGRPERGAARRVLGLTLAAAASLPCAALAALGAGAGLATAVALGVLAATVLRGAGLTALLVGSGGPWPGPFGRPGMAPAARERV